MSRSRSGEVTGRGTQGEHVEHMSHTLHQIRQALAIHRPDPSIPEGRHAAVAVVLTDDLHLLFMRRAEHPGDPWSGHVAFPGGHCEPIDRTSLDTAIRETREELGLDLTHAEVLGTLEDVRTASHEPQLTIRPWVLHLPVLPVIRPNHEVASVHRVALASLLAGRGRSCFHRDWKGRRVTLPCVDFDGVRLWGMTLGMVDDLLNRLDGGGRGMARIRE